MQGSPRPIGDYKTNGPDQRCYKVNAGIRKRTYCCPEPPEEEVLGGKVGTVPVEAGPDEGAFLSMPFGRGFVLDGGSGWIVWFCGIISTFGADMLNSEGGDQHDEGDRNQVLLTC